MAAVFSLGLSGYILRRLPETGAKFLDGENEGRLLVPEMGSAFSPDSPENSMLRSLYLCMYVCMYIVHIYIYVNVNRETFTATAYEFQFASTPLAVTHRYTQ